MKLFCFTDESLRTKLSQHIARSHTMSTKQVFAVCYCRVSGAEDCIPHVGSWIFDNQESAESFFNEKLQCRPQSARVFNIVAERDGLFVVTWSCKWERPDGIEAVSKSTLSLSRRTVMSEYDSPCSEEYGI